MTDRLYKPFGDKVRSIRKMKGLSQEELADKADLDRSYLGAVERGEHNVSLKNILKIAEALAVESAELFKW